MIIGITGGIGSGKSTIAKQLREMGYAIYDTDTQAKRLIVENAQVRQQIERLLGKEAYQDNIYQTQFVAQRVFADPSLLAQLNAIVHPAVKADIKSRISQLQEQDFFFIECAILYQAGFDTLCHKVVAVTAPEPLRLQRVIARDHSSANKVLERMRAQDAANDILRADILIHNDGTNTISTLCQQILHALLTN